MAQEILERRANGGAQSPLGELEKMSERLREKIDQAFGGYSLVDGPSVPWTPLVDVEETEDGFVLQADVPGIEHEDLMVELVGDELAITGQRRQRESTGTIRRQMRRTGRFEYRVALPDHIDADKVEAHLDEGVLTVRIPRSERAQRRKIDVRF